MARTHERTSRGIRGDGDPAGIRALADWARTALAPPVSGLSVALTEARTYAEGAWKDHAGFGFAGGVSPSATQAIMKLVADINRTADHLDEYADRLERAQSQIDQARQLAANNPTEVQVVNGEVMVPVVQEIWIGPEKVEDPDQQAATYERERELYEQIRALVESARAEIVEVQGWMDRVVAELKGQWYLSAGDIITGHAHWLASQYKLRFIERSWPLSFTRDKAKFLADMVRTRKAHDIAGMLDDISREYAERAKIPLDRANTLGIVARVVGKTGYLFLVVGITLDMTSGEPLDQAGASNIGAFYASAWVIARLGGPGTVGALIGGTMAGILINKLVDVAYERALKPILHPPPVIIDDRWAFPEAGNG